MICLTETNDVNLVVNDRRELRPARGAGGCIVRADLYVSQIRFGITARSGRFIRVGSEVPREHNRQTRDFRLIRLSNLRCHNDF
ncbi:hypothetical protein [Novipirellula aureliae]|uniref:hypothetical protein n=1 Tax=Novipirellula aureliae TaxID=2527966 RepID=UPI0011B75D7D|nr:hypothetical protein [Novipirellula aureliae]